ncbi:hypothetical protein SK128_017126 [Halocaridina rubra]|uniref:C-type lectin domain-containing protein n=1 Tax=Halocaridina rubra TaxID=373956 RepID=A0AAN8ZVS5_HALRR
MKTVCQIFLGILITISVATAQQCPPEFWPAGGGCFGVFGGAQDMQWPEARQYCQDMIIPGWSADLAYFDDTTQFEAVAQAYQNVSSGTYPFMWVGIIRVDGQWQYVDGSPIPTSANIWSVGHPHDMNMHVYLDDVTISTAQHSWGRLYATCTSGDFLPIYMCRAASQ